MLGNSAPGLLIILVDGLFAGAAGASDGMDESDEEPTAAAAAGSSGRQAAGQNAGLYNELGQHNPKKAKAGE